MEAEISLDTTFIERIDYWMFFIYLKNNFDGMLPVKFCDVVKLMERYVDWIKFEDVSEYDIFAMGNFGLFGDCFKVRCGIYEYVKLLKEKRYKYKSKCYFYSRYYKFILR